MHCLVIITTCFYMSCRLLNRCQQVPTGANRGPLSLELAAGGSSSGLVVMSLERLTVKHFNKGLANSIRRSYSSAQNRYLRFCRDRDSMLQQPLPASESVLCYFVAHLADSSLKHCTIKVYLSAVRSCILQKASVTPLCHT